MLGTAHRNAAPEVPVCHCVVRIVASMNPTADIRDKATAQSNIAIQVRGVPYSKSFQSTP